MKHHALKNILHGLTTFCVFAMVSFLLFLLFDQSANLNVSVTTSKTDYQSTEAIGLALELENTHASQIQNLVLENQLPEGYQVSTTSQNQTRLEKLDPEERTALSSVFVTDTTTRQLSDTLVDEQPLPETEIHSQDMRFPVMLLTAGCLILCLGLWILNRKKPLRFLPLAYVLIGLVGVLLPPILLMQEQNKVIEIRTHITIDDQPITLVSTIHYTQNVTVQSSPLENLEASEDNFVVGLNDQTLFTVAYHADVSASTPATSITLNHLSDGAISEMYDDGTHGDVTSQDGIYSYLMDVDTSTASTSQYYAMADGHMSNTQTLRVFAQPDEQDKQLVEQVNARMDEIQANYEDDFGYMIADDVDHALDEMTQYARQLYANGTLLSYERNEDNLLVQMNNGMTLIYVPSQRNIDAYDENTSVSVLSLQPCLSMYGDFTDNYIPLPEGINNGMELPDDSAQTLDDTFSHFSNTEYNNEAVDLELIQSFQANQVIIWHGHGDYSQSKHSILLTGDEFDYWAWLFDLNYFIDNVRSLTLNYNGRVGISSKYIDKYVDNMDHSFLYLAACSSGRDDVLAQAFLDKGADAVVANSTTIYTLYNLMMQQATLTKMTELNPATLNYYTLSEALEEAKALYGEDDGQYGTKPEGAARPLIFGGETANQFRLAEVDKGTLSGKICQASDRMTPVANATIQIYYGDTLYQTLNADSAGEYSVELSEANYRIVISAEGYLNFEAYATVTADENTYMETFLLIQNSDATSGTAAGQITNAFTGEGLEGVTLEVRQHWNNTSQGDVVSTITTSTTGEYAVHLPLGNYTVLAKKEGFIESHINIIVQEGTTAQQNGAITPIISGDDFRIILTWSTNPRDLDSHVQGTTAANQTFHTFYSDKSASFDGVEVCNLDVDDTTSYGPETITLKADGSSPYYYYIHRYAGSGSLATSEAQVRIYQGSALIGTFNVPSDGDTNLDYWNVFAIKNGELIIMNTLSATPNVEYAS